MYCVFLKCTLIPTVFPLSSNTFSSFSAFLLESANITRSSAYSVSVILIAGYLLFSCFDSVRPISLSSSIDFF